MTAAGEAEAAAALAIAPALTALNRSLAQDKHADRSSNIIIARNLHSCLRFLASAVNRTGYAAGGRWHGAFIEGQATDPEWLRTASHNGAALINGGADLTTPIRAVRAPDAGAVRPALRTAGHAAWEACHHLGELIIEHEQGGTRPQVPDYAVILGALQAACEPLGAALNTIAARLGGVEPDPFSAWSEDFAGDLPAAYAGAASACRAGGQAQRLVRDRTASDVRVWRSRSRPRPGA